MPVGIACLDRLGVKVPRLCDLAGVEYVLGDLRAGADFREGPGQVVRRLQLSQILHCPQAELVDNCQVQSVSRQGDWMEVQTSQGPWRCRLLVAADGLHSPIRHQLGMHSLRKNWLQRWGWRQHFALKPWNQRVEIHHSDGCEAYVSPAGPDMVGVAVLSHKGLRRHNWLDAFPSFRERLTEPLSPLAGLGPMWQSSRSVHEPGVLLLGDAAGYLDACTGEGLTLAFVQAEALGLQWQAGSGLTFLPHYASSYRRIVRHYYQVTWGALLLARWPRLTAAVLRTWQENPGLLAQVLSANQGLASPFPILAKLLFKVPPQLLAGWLGRAHPIVPERIL